MKTSVRNLQDVAAEDASDVKVVEYFSFYSLWNQLHHILVCIQMSGSRYTYQQNRTRIMQPHDRSRKDKSEVSVIVFSTACMNFYLGTFTHFRSLLRFSRMLKYVNC